MRRSSTLLALLLGAASMGGSCHRVKVERWPAHFVRDGACPYPKARGRLVLVQRTVYEYEYTEVSRDLVVRLRGLPAQRSFVVELEGAEEIGWEPATATTGAKGTARIRTPLGFGGSPVGRTVTVREPSGPALLRGILPEMTRRGDPPAKAGGDAFLEDEEGAAGARVVLSGNPRSGSERLSFVLRGLSPDSPAELLFADAPGEAVIPLRVRPDGTAAATWNSRSGRTPPLGHASLHALSGTPFRVRSGCRVVLEGAIP